MNRAGRDPVRQERTGWRAFQALALTEARSVARHPALLGGATLAAVLTIGDWAGAELREKWLLEDFVLLLVNWAPLHLGAFVAGCTAAMRVSASAELLRAGPVNGPERILAVAAASVVPTLIATVLVAIHLVAIAEAGGILLNATWVIPSPLELAVVPATAGAAFTAGIAAAITVGWFSLILTPFGALAFYTYWVYAWFPAYFLAPYVTSVRAVPRGEGQDAGAYASGEPPRCPPDAYYLEWGCIERDVGIAGWHAVYLVGVALLFAAYAVRRFGADPRVRWLLASGALLTVVGVERQLAAFGGPFDWWGPVSLV